MSAIELLLGNEDSHGSVETIVYWGSRPTASVSIPDRCGDRNMTVRFRKRKLDRDDGMSRQSFPAVRMKKRITPNLCVQVRIGSCVTA
jgi:hypothetical protein